LKSALIIFVRNPALGKVKTRLAKEIGDESALSVYKNLLNHTQSITTAISCDRFVFYADYVNENDIWLKELYHKRLQSGNDLGGRMKEAFLFLFKEGYERVVIIGSDCYELTGTLIKEAFHQLINHRIVIGPANDGGYYLLGMNTFIEDVFNNKEWSTSTVLEETLKDIESAGYAYYLLPELNDVDNADDIKKYPELLVPHTYLTS
jgi:hypothetical protein